MALPECPVPASLREQRLWQPLAHSESTLVLAASECTGLGRQRLHTSPLSSEPAWAPASSSAWRGWQETPLWGVGGREELMLTSCGAHAVPGMNREPQHLPLLWMSRRSSGVGPAPAVRRGAGCLPQMSSVLLPLLAAVYPAPLGEFSWDLLISKKSHGRENPEPAWSPRAWLRLALGLRESTQSLHPSRPSVQVFGQPWCSGGLGAAETSGS